MRNLLSLIPILLVLGLTVSVAWSISRPTIEQDRTRKKKKKIEIEREEEIELEPHRIFKSLLLYVSKVLLWLVR